MKLLNFIPVLFLSTVVSLPVVPFVASTPKETCLEILLVLNEAVENKVINEAEALRIYYSCMRLQKI